MPLLDALRSLAVLGVVVIHVVAGPLLHPSRHSAAELRGLVLLDALARVSVPALLVISGVVLMRGWCERPQPVIVFWRRRFARVLPAYAVWSAVYTAGSSAAGAGAYARHLLCGDASFHTWYVPLILHLYLLFPALAAAVRRCHRARWTTAALLAAAVAWAVVRPVVPWALPAPSGPGWLAGYFAAGPLAVWQWLPYFLLGLALGGPAATQPQLPRRWWPVLLSVGAVLVAGLVAARVAGLRLSADGDHARQQALFGWQTIGTPVFAAVTAGWLVLWLQRPAAARLVERLARLAPATFGVYLAHVFVMQRLQHWFGYALLTYFAGTVPVAVLLVAALTWLLINGLGRVPHLARWVGLEARPVT